jgi:hypothetical protein
LQRGIRQIATQRDHALQTGIGYFDQTVEFGAR